MKRFNIWFFFRTFCSWWRQQVRNLIFNVVKCCGFFCLFVSCCRQRRWCWGRRGGLCVTVCPPTRCAELLRTRPALTAPRHTSKTTLSRTSAHVQQLSSLHIHTIGTLFCFLSCHCSVKLWFKVTRHAFVLPYLGWLLYRWHGVSDTCELRLFSLTAALMCLL